LVKPKDAFTQTLARVTSDSVDLSSVTLRCETQGQPDRELELGMIRVLVGTDPECGLCLKGDETVSRRHAEFRRTEEALHVRDLGSKNGTFINGIQIIEAKVLPGHVLKIGSSRLSVLVGDEVKRVPLSQATSFGEAQGQSVVMRALFALLERASGTEFPILLRGETGTGKEILARAIHDASPRKDGPFVVFDCGATAPSLVESQLFGHLKGSFTGADRTHEGLFSVARGGTLFLDEIGELPLELQARFLRALESKTFRPLGSSEYQTMDVRIVAATHRDLQAQVSEGTFRQDLYFRLAVVLAEVPPLRERREDLPLLVRHLWSRLSPDRSMDDFSPQLVRLLESHTWPGNVRELSNVLMRLVLFPGAHKALMPHTVTVALPGPASEVLHLPLREARAAVVSVFEQAYLKAKIDQHQGNISATAREMGISRQFLYRMLEVHGLKGADDE
jgi:transcriptional regulator with PAS, ATPase and Fis domain